MRRNSLLRIIISYQAVMSICSDFVTIMRCGCWIEQSHTYWNWTARYPFHSTSREFDHHHPHHHLLRWQCIEVSPHSGSHLRNGFIAGKQATAPQCITVHHSASQCITVHHRASQCTTVHHSASHCTTVHHMAPHCTTVNHSASQCTAPQRYCKGVPEVSLCTPPQYVACAEQWSAPLYRCSLH